MSFPATYNISYYKGDRYEFVIRPKDSAGDPFPISDTTHTPYFYISTGRGENASLTKAGTATINGGNVVATILPSLGNTLVSGTTYFYDVSIKKNAGEIYTLLTGTLSVTGDITEPGS
jgi:hypothetical protein